LTYVIKASGLNLDPVSCIGFSRQSGQDIAQIEPEDMGKILLDFLQHLVEYV